MTRTATTTDDEVFVDSAGQPETRGIELIAEADRHGRPRDLFFVWAAPNVSVLNFTIGATMITLGLTLWQAVLVILVGSLPWIFTGIVAIAGPAAGTSGSVISRAMYGILGNRVLVAFTGWLISAVFLALNWLASSFMGADLLARIGLTNPVVWPIAVTVIVSAITVVVAVYGHGLILRAYTGVTVFLLVVFLAVTAFVLPHVDWTYRPAQELHGVPLWAAVTIGITLLASTPLSYSNSPDLARYLPASASPARIVAATAFGGAVPSAFFTIVGALLATGVTRTQLDAGIDVALLDLLPAWLGVFLVIGVVVNTISLNGMTVYSSSMALQAIGIPIRRIPSAVVVGAIGTALTIYLVLSTSLLEAVNLMLQFLVIVTGPAMAVFVTDIALRRNRYDGLDLFDERRGARFWYTGGFSAAGMTAVIVGGVATALGLSTTVWSGAISTAMNGVDLSVELGMIVSAVLYAVIQKSPLGAAASSPLALSDKTPHTRK
ncbi:MAG TPA: cytosine permease [Microbacterium sp.]|uniref:purine-cytosine permease family protein n=1 Tax=Microbacterium sp. TaxID=51671 RepID=UPI002B4931C5|nr:cytosine permease [Microbacterium sp.]HKT56089.1 cytosine permease [Microbacterium sp.]